MKIYNYRTSNLCSSAHDAWQDCLFTDAQQLNGLESKTMVTFGQQTFLHQHQITYVTGKETSHAHHFAKMIAKAVLDGKYDHAPSLHVKKQDQPVSVLWIDTVRGPHACATFYKEMTANLGEDCRFSLICMDLLGSFREDYWVLTREIEQHICRVNPTLVVIDDMDHLMPDAGINTSAEFKKIVRDRLNHTETAFLLVGYNHLTKKSCSSGYAGKLLFYSSNNILSVSTQHAVSRVRLVKSYEICESMLDYPGNEFCYAIDADNLPHEVVKNNPPTGSAYAGTTSEPLASGFISQTALSDIISEVMEPGEAISPDELTSRLTARRQQLNRIDRSRNLIAQAAHLGILAKADDGTNNYKLAPVPPIANLHTDGAE